MSAIVKSRLCLVFYLSTKKTDQRFWQMDSNSRRLERNADFTAKRSHPPKVDPAVRDGSNWKRTCICKSFFMLHRRIELRTPWLKVMCSTSWANGARSSEPHNSITRSRRFVNGKIQFFSGEREQRRPPGGGKERWNWKSDEILWKKSAKTLIIFPNFVIL